MNTLLNRQLFVQLFGRAFGAAQSSVQSWNSEQQEQEKAASDARALKRVQRCLKIRQHRKKSTQNLNRNFGI